MDEYELTNMENATYKIKALVRWLRYSLRFGVSYERYTKEQIKSAKGFDHPLGYYEARGRCIVYREADGTVKFLW